MKLKKYLNSKASLKDTIILFYFPLVISSVLAIIIFSFICSTNYFFIEEMICVLIILTPLVFAIFYKLIRRFKAQIKKFLSFVSTNIFIISIGIFIIYIGNKLITEVTNTIEKVNNIVPIATHDGFAIYNRDKDMFFEYKFDSYYSKKYGRKTFTPSLEIKLLNEAFYEELE